VRIILGNLWTLFVVAHQPWPVERWRYGLDMHEPHSLQEIGELLGISRERVRQVEKQAFTKLRRSGQSALLAELG
jgi:DNA-directed RNA polymerase sigma subunit (sigma70/sigma32)